MVRSAAATVPDRPLRLPLLFGLFFVSGASGLIFEILWIRALGLQFGTTTPAIATVLAAFMGGLALGNLLFGPRADQHPAPLKLYRKIEIGIGLSGLATAALLLRGDGLLQPLAGLVAEAGALATPLRLLLFGGLLLVPTTLMGATLPVMARSLVRGGVTGRTMGQLYAINTAGAVAGALLPDLLLVPRIGLLATACVAAAGNLGVAAVVGFAGLPTSTPPRPAGAPRSLTARLPIFLYGVSGFCAMGYEILWSRVHHHFSMGQVASFAVLLATFLVFLSIGSLVATPLADRSRRPVVTAAALLALTGPAAFLPIVGIGAWAEHFNRLLPSIRGVHRAAPSDVLALALGSAVWLEAAACLLMGAAFPFLAAATVREGDAGRGTGRLLASNTLAGVGGSVVACFVLLPALGVQASLLLLAAVATATGGLAVLLCKPVDRRLGLAAAVAVVAVGLCSTAVPQDLLRRSYFAAFHGADTRIEVLTEGPTTTAAVARRYRFDQPAYLLLLTPGVTMSDTQLGAKRYMGLMGHLPMALSDDASEALLICYGVGNTARSLLSWPSLERLDVVDISSEVLDSSDRFAEVHGGIDPLADPRVEVHIDDGRQHLLTSGRRYDAITSEPPPPTDAGVVNLYTREYYTAVRDALKPGGVLAQWLPLFQLTSDESEAIVAAFTAEFEHTALWYGYSHQWVLIGSDRPIEPGAGWRRLQEPTVRADLELIGADPDSLADEQLQDDAGLRVVASRGSALTDDRPTLQYPRRGLAGQVEVPEGLVAPGRLLAERLPALSLPDKVERERASAAAFAPTLAADPGDRQVLSLLRIGEDWSTPAEAHVAAGGGETKALLVLARRALYAGRFAEAEALLERIDSATMDERWYELLLAGARDELWPPP